MFFFHNHKYIYVKSKKKKKFDALEKIYKTALIRTHARTRTHTHTHTHTHILLQKLRYCNIVLKLSIGQDIQTYEHTHK